MRVQRASCRGFEGFTFVRRAAIGKVANVTPARAGDQAFLGPEARSMLRGCNARNNREAECARDIA
jgi:hypothetical protein